MKCYMYYPILAMFMLLFIGDLKQEVLKSEIRAIVMKGESNKINALIKAGMNPNLKDELGETLLMDAARHKQPKILEILLNNGAYVNAMSNSLRTALYFAAHSGCYDCTRILIQAGAYIDQESIEGETALGEAAGNGYTGILKLLISRGANVNIANKDGVTPLMRVHDQLGNNNNAAILVRAGADINAISKKKRTALMFATAACHAAKVRLLIDNKADVNIRSDDGNTALSLAQEKWLCGEVVEMLIQAGAK